MQKGASGGALPSASDDDGGGFKARCASGSRAGKSLDVEISVNGGVGLTSAEVRVATRHGGRQSDDAGAEQCRHDHRVMNAKHIDQKPTKAGPTKKAA
jgi:hypothetical protein